MDRPVIGIVSRFVNQKGFDLIAEVANELMKENVAIVALGSGQPEYESLFQALAEHFPTRAAVRIAYDEPLAHKIIAGADMISDSVALRALRTHSTLRSALWYCSGCSRHRRPG